MHNYITLSREEGEFSTKTHIIKYRPSIHNRMKKYFDEIFNHRVIPHTLIKKFYLENSSRHWVNLTPTHHQTQDNK